MIWDSFLIDKNCCLFVCLGGGGVVSNLSCRVEKTRLLRISGIPV